MRTAPAISVWKYARERALQEILAGKFAELLEESSCHLSAVIRGVGFSLHSPELVKYYWDRSSVVGSLHARVLRYFVPRCSQLCF
jgi:hypothetical protein